ncbi:hypothetical protein [Tsukamurella sp. 1534]|uniref:hypothetical protein n=1 Tax=Tsukamurella sp. 1534 TaxID=1151061 RepID=UPI0011D1C8F2|nr:hypothetical protein [Tsukamurella sp. 1534]
MIDYASMFAIMIVVIVVLVPLANVVFDDELLTWWVPFGIAAFLGGFFYSKVASRVERSTGSSGGGRRRP